jgi:hypothetical protein
MIVGGFDGVERRAAAVTAGIIPELLGVHEQKAHVGGIIAEVIVIDARDKRSGVTMDARDSRVRRDLDLKLGILLHGECLVQEVNGLDATGVDAIQRVDGWLDWSGLRLVTGGQEQGR